MVGVGAADAGGRGNINAGDGGVAFLLASAGALPGACDAVRGCLGPTSHAPLKVLAMSHIRVVLMQIWLNELKSASRCPSHTHGILLKADHRNGPAYALVQCITCSKLP